MSYSERVEVAREYYNSAVHEMYKECWGGENHHLGIFDDTDSFFEAAQRSNENLVSKLKVTENDVILDIGSGFCGLPRYVAKNTPCKKVVALNISEKENEYAREKNREEGLGDRIEVIDGDFNYMPFSDNFADIMISQESMLHSPDKGKLLVECARVLKPKGQFVFSDILEKDLTREEAERIYSRIKVPDLSTFEFYKEKLPEAGFEVKEVQNLGSENLGKSYQSVHDQVMSKKDHLINERGIPQEIVNNALDGLKFWVEKAYEGKIGWGLFVAELK